MLTDILGLMAILLGLILALLTLAGVAWLVEVVLRPRRWEYKRQRRIYDSMVLPEVRYGRPRPIAQAMRGGPDT